MVPMRILLFWCLKWQAEDKNLLQAIGRCVQGPVYKGGEGQEMKIIFLKVDHILAFILFALYPSIIASFF